MSEKLVNGTCNTNGDVSNKQCNDTGKEIRVWCDGW